MTGVKSPTVKGFPSVDCRCSTVQSDYILCTIKNEGLAFLFSVVDILCVWGAGKNIALYIVQQLEGCDGKSRAIE